MPSSRTPSPEPAPHAPCARELSHVHARLIAMQLMGEAAVAGWPLVAACIRTTWRMAQADVIARWQEEQTGKEQGQ